MTRTYYILPLIFILMGQSCSEKPAEIEKLHTDEATAEYLSGFAFECIDREYPNKPGQVMGDETYLASPSEMHPAFYGCFDWHSAVHSHWTLLTLLREAKELPNRDKIIAKIRANITERNIAGEIEFFTDEYNTDFQRTYGWAWLLKLDEALREWDDPIADELHSILEPLADLIAEKFIGFLDVLIYPIRVGEHPNTAFGMSFAYDYAKKYNPPLARKIEEKAREYYMDDKSCPLGWEPGGFDFLSPCLQEASLMNKILDKDEFSIWLDNFLPGLVKEPEKYLEPAIVTDASDGKLAHLDGLNFSRAWCLFEIGHSLGNNELINLGVNHFNFSYEQLDAEEYMGSHWLASFATYAVKKYSQASGIQISGLLQ